MLKGHGAESKEISAVALMREMGWTYEEYVAQPTWVIDTIKIMISEENKKQKADSKRK
jgi:5-methylcytosine-specific restriction endonuclease McrBC regulatory subunit McrC